MEHNGHMTSLRTPATVRSWYCPDRLDWLISYTLRSRRIRRIRRAAGSPSRISAR
jgi:hypothetical protein